GRRTRKLTDASLAFSQLRAASRLKALAPFQSPFTAWAGLIIGAARMRNAVRALRLDKRMARPLDIGLSRVGGVPFDEILERDGRRFRVHHAAWAACGRVRR